MGKFRFYVRCIVAVPMVIGLYLFGSLMCVFPPIGILLILGPFVVIGNGFMFLMTDDADRRKHYKKEMLEPLELIGELITYPIAYTRAFIHDKPLPEF